MHQNNKNIKVVRWISLMIIMGAIWYIVIGFMFPDHNGLGYNKSNLNYVVSSYQGQDSLVEIRVFSNRRDAIIDAKKLYSAIFIIIISSFSFICTFIWSDLK